MSLESRTIDFSCESHGVVQVKQVRLSGSQWGTAICGECLAEQEANRQARQESERITEAQKARRRKIERCNEQSRIPARFAETNFASYIPEGDKPAKLLEICRNYAENFPSYRSIGKGMILCGNAGTGKTHLACAIASHAIREHAASAVYVTAGRAFRSVKDTFRRESLVSEEQAISNLASPDLLILDEIGIQYGSSTELNILFDIVNERYEALKPTILISNLALPKLTEYAGERVIDRMRENGGKIIIFDWKSHRGAA